MKISKNPTTKAIIPEIRGTLGAIRFPAFGEIKYDGEACLIMYDEMWDDKIVTTNKYGTMRSDWSSLDEIAELLESKEVRKAVFLAELFYGQGKAGALYDLLSHKDDDLLNIKIYDVIHLVNDHEIRADKTPLIDRKEILGDIFGESDYLLRPFVVNSKDEVNKQFKCATDDQGYEGIVIKAFDGTLNGTGGPCAWVKMKKKDQSDYPIVIVDPTLERIEVAVPDPTQPLTQFVRVGVKCPNKYKKDVKVGDMVTIEHQGVLDSGSLRHPVFIGKAGKGE